jgi:hypothetical protein
VTAAAALPATPAADAAPGTADVTITVTRDPEAAKHSLQVVLAPVPAAGQPALGWLVANLPPEADQVSGRIGAGYAGATLQVIDVSPFPRGCAEGLTGCIALFAPVAPAGPAGPAGPSPPATVTPDKLHRLTGDAVIAPGDAARQAIAAAGAPPAIAVVRLCLTADGKVDSVRMIKTTKVPAYDEQLLADIKSTWAFEPYIADGNPAAVCTSVTLKAP